jgi:drug/metabolite transporter (DMT)-like permease
MTIIGNLFGDLCYFVALDNIGVGRALSTANSYPIFVSIFSVLWLGETLSVKLLTGTTIIIAGLAFLNCTKKSAIPPSEKVRSNILGFTMATLTSILWASMLSMQKWVLTTHGVEPLTLTFYRAVSLIFITWGFWYFRKNNEERKHVFSVGYKKWLSPFLAGAISLGFGGISFAYALETIPASVAAPITATNPVIAAAIARFAFNEKLSPVQWFGIFMVIIGGIQVSS